jgi:hypothetical protein
MAAEAVYVVRSTLNPAVSYRTDRAEYEHLIELNILDSLDEVVIPADQIVVQTTEPVAPAVGLIWANPNIA